VASDWIRRMSSGIGSHASVSYGRGPRRTLHAVGPEDFRYPETDPYSAFAPCVDGERWRTGS
jgi:hypothetical protein